MFWGDIQNGKKKMNNMNSQIQIENLKCGGCATTIKRELLSIDEVTEVEVDMQNAIVSFTSKNNVLKLVAEKLSKLGYPEVGTKNNVLHKAKSFVSCAVGRIDF